MRRVLFSCLAALLLVTSVGLGQARGAVLPTDGVVICQGHAISVIWLDADGNEVEAQMLCPDAALSLLGDAGAATPDMPAWGGGATWRGPLPDHGPARPAQLSANPARGPPWPV